MPMRSELRARLKELYQSAPRDVYFEAIRSSAVAEGGRLIVCHYREPEEAVDVEALLSGLGYDVSGETQAPGVSVVWCDRHVSAEI